MPEFTIQDRPSRDGLRAGIIVAALGMVLLVICGYIGGVLRELALLFSVSVYLTFIILAILESVRQKRILDRASQSLE